MPYIKKEEREDVALTGPSTAGQLNYRFTRDIENYVRRKGESYQTFNDIIGALEGAKLEFYRRVVGQYEDEKIKQNGDAYILIGNDRSNPT